MADPCDQHQTPGQDLRPNGLRNLTGERQLRHDNAVEGTQESLGVLAESVNYITDTPLVTSAFQVKYIPLAAFSRSGLPPISDL